MHAVLKEGEETIFDRPLPPARAERLKVIKEGCDEVLVDLQNLVEKYESLGTQTKRTWVRMKWGNEDIAEIRARLNSNIAILTAFISTSQVSVEIKLDKFIEEFRQGKKETSIISLQTVDSLSANDRAVWRSIRKELEEIGISLAAFEANRDFIFDWFVRAFETGAFEEERRHGLDDESSGSDEQQRWSDEEDTHDDTEQQIEPTNIESLESVIEEWPLTRRISSQAARGTGVILPEREFKTFGPKDRTNGPRVAPLAAGSSRFRQRLIGAVYTKNVSMALEMLEYPALFGLLDLETLNEALLIATYYTGDCNVSPLISQLITRGADVNYISSDSSERTPLWNSVLSGSLNDVRLLVENGADVNYTGSNRTPISETGNYALDFAPRAALDRDDTTILRYLFSSGVDVNAQYLLPYIGRQGAADVNMFSLTHEATFRGALPAIEILLQFSAEVDAVSRHCGTPLMLALLEQRRIDVVKVLLDRGADPNFKSASCPYLTMDGKFYSNPIEAAVISGKASIVRLLLNRGAVPDRSTLTLAASVAETRVKEEYPEIIEMLVEALKQ